MHGAARALASGGEDDPEGASHLGALPNDDAAEAEPVCLDTLYRQQSPRLLRSLARRTSSREEARDLLQDIFCRLARLGASGPLRLARPEAYLSRVASNVLRDRARTAARQMSASHIPADEDRLAGLDQHRVLESRDMLARLEAAMLKLRPRTREIFMAHRLDGLTYSEIAERTGMSIKGVKKQMSKAIAQIDRMLDRD